MANVLRGSTVLFHGIAQYSFARQQFRRIAGFTSFSRSHVALSLVAATFAGRGHLCSATLCEGTDSRSFLEQITKKDKDGKTDWTETMTQVTGSDFWDKVATASGEKVSMFKSTDHGPAVKGFLLEIASSIFQGINF